MIMTIDGRVVAANSRPCVRCARCHPSSTQLHGSSSRRGALRTPARILRSVLCYTPPPPRTGAFCLGRASQFSPAPTCELKSFAATRPHFRQLRILPPALPAGMGRRHAGKLTMPVPCSARGYQLLPGEWAYGNGNGRAAGPQALYRSFSDTLLPPLPPAGDVSPRLRTRRSVIQE